MRVATRFAPLLDARSLHSSQTHLFFGPLGHTGTVLATVHWSASQRVRPFGCITARARAADTRGRLWWVRRHDRTQRIHAACAGRCRVRARAHALWRSVRLESAGVCSAAGDSQSLHSWLLSHHRPWQPSHSRHSRVMIRTSSSLCRFSVHCARRVSSCCHACCPASEVRHERTVSESHRV